MQLCTHENLILCIFFCLCKGSENFDLVRLICTDTKDDFLAHLNNVHGELLYYPRRWCWRWLWCWRWCRRPQMLKFSLKFLRPHYFLTLSLI